MGKALYRKHRSRSLDEVVGQEHITDTLKNALKKGAISHAYLFTGPRGVGKTSIARILAHEINKIDYDDESIHLDIIEIDAASNRRIDEIRDLRDKVHIAPISAKFKVYIIDEVHMLTREAFNALLKTLEEPPEHVIFILATTEAHKVPDTIISRTQKFTFKPIATDKAVSHLQHIAKLEKIKISKEALKLVAEHGDGSFRDSISMLDQLSGLDNKSIDLDDVTSLLGLPDEKVIDEIIKAVELNDPKDLFAKVQQLKEKGVDGAQAAKSISAVLRDKIITKDTTITHSKLIQLSRDLLPLTTGSNNFLGLELSLLEAMNVKNEPLKNTPKSEMRPSKKTIPLETFEESTKQQEKPTQEPKVKKIEKIKEKTTDTADPVEGITTVSSFDLKLWNELLNDLKTKHNTLYGVLRMTTPSYDEGQLTMTFNFGFHKNRVDEPKNSTIITEYLKKYFGISKFATLVDASKKLVKKPKKITRPEQDDAVKSVSNIFEGAQLLES